MGLSVGDVFWLICDESTSFTFFIVIVKVNDVNTLLVVPGISSPSLDSPSHTDKGWWYRYCAHTTTPSVDFLFEQCYYSF